MLKQVFAAINRDKWKLLVIVLFLTSFYLLLNSKFLIGLPKLGAYSVLFFTLAASCWVQYVMPIQLFSQQKTGWLGIRVWILQALWTLLTFLPVPGIYPLVILIFLLGTFLFSAGFYTSVRESLALWNGIKLVFLKHPAKWLAIAVLYFGITFIFRWIITPNPYAAFCLDIFRTVLWLVCLYGLLVWISYPQQEK